MALHPRSQFFERQLYRPAVAVMEGNPRRGVTIAELRLPEEGAVHRLGPSGLHEVGSKTTPRSANQLQKQEIVRKPWLVWGFDLDKSGADDQI